MNYYIIYTGSFYQVYNELDTLVYASAIQKLAYSFLAKVRS